MIVISINIFTRLENKLIITRFYIMILFTIDTKLNNFYNNTIIEIKYDIFLKINFIGSINIHDNETIIKFIDIKTLNDKNKIEFLTFKKNDNDLNKTRNNLF